eukprot:sb/3478203/
MISPIYLTELETTARWTSSLSSQIRTLKDLVHVILEYTIECPAFTVEGSTKGNWAASPVGTTATIECAANHILVGISTLTCQQDLSWSSDVPQCDKIGEFNQ